MSFKFVNEDYTGNDAAGTSVDTIARRGIAALDESPITIRIK